MSPFRSDAWFRGRDEVAMLHRVALRMSGNEIINNQVKPIIGIANSASDLNPCNLPLEELVPAVKEGVIKAGGIPVEFPTISLGEDLMKPSAMLYRNLLAIEVEEMIRSNPLDGIVILANCDKSVPGALMGAVSANLPTVLVTGGARKPAMFQGRRIGTGTDLWRLWDQRRSGMLGDSEWEELEKCLSCSVGACNTMGTASSMAIIAEALGLMVPGSSTIPTHDQRAVSAAATAGGAAVRCVIDDIRPTDILIPGAFSNAVKVLHAIGGSTNVIIHLAAIAGRVGIAFPLDEVGSLGNNIPVLVDVEPSGSGLVQDFDGAGGVPALFRELGNDLDLTIRSVTGETVAQVMASARPANGVIRQRSNALHHNGAFRILRGSLAPDGAVIKISAASSHLLTHSGPAVVFYGYEDMISRIDDPNLEVDASSVLILVGCGPVGVPGMPEWGMIPIPVKLAKQGVMDMVRVSDSRMSGTSFGTVVLHVAPEAALGGPLGLVRDGDMIELDVEAGRIDLVLSQKEFDLRRNSWRPPKSPHLRGWPALYLSHVMQAPEGCDLDFLRAPTLEHRKFIEPTIGRS